MTFVAAPVVAALAGVAFIVAERLSHRLADPGHPFSVADHPNERSLHEVPTPRTGGLAIHAGVMIALAAWLVLRGLAPRLALPVTAPGPTLWWILGGAVGVGVVSLADDVGGVSPWVRLVGHLAMGGVAVVGGGLAVRGVPVPGIGVLRMGILSVPASIIAVVWMANLYNFMDGMDGLAGGMSVVGFGLLALLFWLGSLPAPALVALLIATSAAGFLVHNYPPARIFMGDVGAVPLGFLAGALSLWGVRAAAFDLWVPLLAFSPFVVDATATLVRRLVRGERVWHAHRTHAYQRLVLAGWGHRPTVLAEYGLMAAAAACALAYQHVDSRSRGAILAMWVMAYAVLLWAVRRRVRAAVGRP